MTDSISAQLKPMPFAANGVETEITPHMAYVMQLIDEAGQAGNWPNLRCHALLGEKTETYITDNYIGGQDTNTIISEADFQLLDAMGFLYRHNAPPHREEQRDVLALSLQGQKALHEWHYYCKESREAANVLADVEIVAPLDRNYGGLPLPGTDPDSDPDPTPAPQQRYRQRSLFQDKSSTSAIYLQMLGNAAITGSSAAAHQFEALTRPDEVEEPDPMPDDTQPIEPVESPDSSGQAASQSEPRIRRERVWYVYSLSYEFDEWRVSSPYLLFGSGWHIAYCNPDERVLILASNELIPSEVIADLERTFKGHAEHFTPIILELDHHTLDLLKAAYIRNESHETDISLESEAAFYLQLGLEASVFDIGQLGYVQGQLNSMVALVDSVHEMMLSVIEALNHTSNPEFKNAIAYPLQHLKRASGQITGVKARILQPYSGESKE